MNKVFRILFLVVSISTILISCDKKREPLPTGFQLIASDGRSHFLFVEEYQIGDRVAQREAGRIVCTVFNQHDDYCEVYMWRVKSDIPKKMPIINRKTMIGKYEMKDGRTELNPLRDN